MASTTNDDESAYETGLEDLDGEDDVPTPTLEKQNPITKPLPPASTPSPASTELGGGSVDERVTRRKSVRLNVPPSASSTPAATPDTGSEFPINGRQSKEWTSRIADVPAAGEKDMWADSSDEDEDYVRARKLLNKAQKKATEAAAEAAASGAKRDKRTTHPTRRSSTHR